MWIYFKFFSNATNLPSVGRLSKCILRVCLRLKLLAATLLVSKSKNTKVVNNRLLYRNKIIKMKLESSIAQRIFLSVSGFRHIVSSAISRYLCLQNNKK